MTAAMSCASSDLNSSLGLGLGTRACPSLCRGIPGKGVSLMVDRLLPRRIDGTGGIKKMRLPPRRSLGASGCELGGGLTVIVSALDRSDALSDSAFLSQCCFRTRSISAAFASAVASGSRCVPSLREKSSGQDQAWLLMR